MMRSIDARKPVLAALFTGFIIIGAYIVVPLPFSPVPIVLQNYFVVLAGLILGPVYGAFSVAVYLVLGIIGLPVFSAGRGGFAHFIGPTGGYLVGFLVAAPLAALIASRDSGPIRTAIAATTGMIAVYVVGVPWLASVADLPLSAAMAAGALPFIPGDAAKVVAAVVTVRWARPVLVAFENAGST